MITLVWLIGSVVLGVVAAYSDGDRVPAIIVSNQRWSRALATSRRLAARRLRGRKP